MKHDTMMAMVCTGLLAFAACDRGEDGAAPKTVERKADDAKPSTEAKVDVAKSDAKPDAKPDSKSDAKPDAKSDAKPDTEPETPDEALDADEPADAPPSIDDAIEAPDAPSPPRLGKSEPMTWKKVATAKSAGFPADAGAIVVTDGGTFTRADDGSLRAIAALDKPVDPSPDPGPEPEPEPEDGEDDEDDYVDLVMRVDYEDYEGRWPDNLWYVKHLHDGRRGDETRLWQWNGQGWKPAEVKMSPDDGGVLATGNSISVEWGTLERHWSPRSGYVVAYSAEDSETPEYLLSRVGSRMGAPVAPKHPMEGYSMALVETRAGSTFVFYRTKDDQLAITRSCRADKPNCGYAPRFLAPNDKCDRTPKAVPRGHHSMSANLRCWDNSKPDVLVHYGHGGWSLEKPPGGEYVHQLEADGSALWAVISQTNTEGAAKGEVTLWHRTGPGVWTKQPIPGGASTTEAPRIRPIGDGRLWALVKQGGKTHLYEGAPAGAAK